MVYCCVRTRPAHWSRDLISNAFLRVLYRKLESELGIYVYFIYFSVAIAPKSNVFLNFINKPQYQWVNDYIFRTFLSEKNFLNMMNDHIETVTVTVKLRTIC